MCGIAGILAYRGAPPTHTSLQTMIETLKHRGPDGFGFHVQGEVGFAHARLAIIDLVSGAQPMCNEDGTVWVTFNGEIFNYVELRQDLRRAGHVFRTASDTEVIVHAYEEYGDGFVHHLNGQFAMGLWDASRHKLLLARDRVGIRPLYYALVGGRLLFASEAKAIFAEGSLTPRLDLESLAQIFSYWAPLEHRSAFAGVAAVPPGCILTIDEGVPRITRYWDWDFGDPRTPGCAGVDDYAEELRALLHDAVRLQLRSDVPIASYLSGGLDSTVVTALAKQISTTPIRSFSLGFDDPELDERAHQREVAETLGVENTQFVCADEAIAGAFATAIWHGECPTVRAAPVPLMLLASVVREAGFKVALTGEGADEVFAGYDVFREAKIRRFVARQPQSKWRARLLERLYPYLAHSPVRRGAFAQEFFLAGGLSPDDAVFSLAPRVATAQRAWRFFSPSVRDALGRFDPTAELKATIPQTLATWPSLGRDQYVEAHTLTSGYVLSSQGDRMAMAHSVETRLPFFDHRLIEFAGRLPPHVKLRGLQEKYVLKRAVKNDTPARSRARPKQPYRAPDSRSFFHSGHAAAVVQELLAPSQLRSAGYFDENAVQRLLDKCQKGRVIGFSDNISFMGILSTMALHQAFITRPARRNAT